MSEVERTKQLIKEFQTFLEHSPWQGLYSSRIDAMLERVDQPCELAVVGRVKAGKSSFLNALLGEELAMVGETEMTATINFFKYGSPKDENHPVRVVWEDGSEEWQTRAFLDSLQGNTKEVLDKASKIDHLEYFVQNPILNNVTLVDTPGTGSIVDEHEDRTNDYLHAGKEQLRKKHNEQSVNLKNRADAVIVITERVPTNETSTLVSNLSMDTSAFNALGVMTKIDSEFNVTLEDWNRRSSQYAEMLRNQLNTIIPISASIYKTVKKLDSTGRLREIKESLKNIPADEFEEVCSSKDNFLGNADDLNEYFNSYGVSYEQRCHLAKGVDIWMTFYTIAKVLHEMTYEDAVEYLINYSGMERMREVIERQFLNRSRIIRCAKIVKDMHSILDEINIRRLYDLRTDVSYRDVYLSIIKESKLRNEDAKLAFEKFVKTNVCTKEQYDKLIVRIKELMQKVEDLQLKFSGTDKKSEALLLLEKKQSSFLPSEYKELEILFGKYADEKAATDRPTVARRQAYWRSRKNSSSNAEVNKIIELAVYAYGTIKTD